MAAGDLITADYQYEFRGLLFGSLTPYVVTRVRGLLGMPNIESEDEDRQDADGFHPGSVSYAGRELDIDLTTLSGDALTTEDRLDILRGVFRKRDEFEPFVFQRPGKGKRRVYARTVRRAIESNYEVAHGKVEAVLMLEASDPFIYANDESETQFNIPSGSTTAAAVIANGGSEPTPPVVTLTGAVTNPVIINQDDEGRQLQLTIATNAGDILEIDFMTRTILRNGQDAGGAVERPESQWWMLNPGNNNIQVSRTGTATTVTTKVTHRDTWA